MKMYINKKRIKMFLENNVKIANLYFNKYSNLLYDETTLPFISIYYYNPKPYTEDETDNSVKEDLTKEDYLNLISFVNYGYSDLIAIMKRQIFRSML